MPSEVPRVASLLPSATEILYALGAGDLLVGRSHECDHPPEVRRLPVLTSTEVDPSQDSGVIDAQVRELLDGALSLYHVHAERLAALSPDVIVTQDHCEVCAVSLDEVEQACSTFGARVVSLHPKDLASIRRDFVRVAEAIDRDPAPLLHDFDRRLARVRAAAEGKRRPGVVAIEWLDPPMVAGGYLPELIRIAGGEPLIVSAPERFATVDWAAILRAEPEITVLLPCGFTVDKTLAELDRVPAQLLSSSRVFVADGNAYFNRPGPRLADSAEILSGLFGHGPIRKGAVAL